MHTHTRAIAVTRLVNQKGGRNNLTENLVHSAWAIRLGKRNTRAKSEHHADARHQADRIVRWQICRVEQHNRANKREEHAWQCVSLSPVRMDLPLPIRAITMHYPLAHWLSRPVGYIATLSTPLCLWHFCQAGQSLVWLRQFELLHGTFHWWAYGMLMHREDCSLTARYVGVHTVHYFIYHMSVQSWAWKLGDQIQMALIKTAQYREHCRQQLKESNGVCLRVYPYEICIYTQSSHRYINNTFDSG